MKRQSKPRSHSNVLRADHPTLKKLNQQRLESPNSQRIANQPNPAVRNPVVYQLETTYRDRLTSPTLTASPSNLAHLKQAQPSRQNPQESRHHGAQKPCLRRKVTSSQLTTTFPLPTSKPTPTGKKPILAPISILIATFQLFHSRIPRFTPLPEIVLGEYPPARLMDRGPNRPGSDKSTYSTYCSSIPPS
ncbi:hypothetical protein BU16DRAFT_72365 [Lophium mytilinum]|uniref:Uncharacterized protein n=1 Tax=Lophium mytilinum TaxID=390894 RepID=A0A6A6QLJ2_9PEZI|nr:hypothetical protein BU16DRAFT_72365 [Lophium mytilinum]